MSGVDLLTGVAWAERPRKATAFVEGTAKKQTGRGWRWREEIRTQTVARQALHSAQATADRLGCGMPALASVRWSHWEHGSQHAPRDGDCPRTWTTSPNLSSARTLNMTRVCAASSRPLIVHRSAYTDAQAIGPRMRLGYVLENGFEKPFKRNTSCLRSTSRWIVVRWCGPVPIGCGRLRGVAWYLGEGKKGGRGAKPGAER